MRAEHAYAPARWLRRVRWLITLGEYVIDVSLSLVSSSEELFRLFVIASVSVMNAYAERVCVCGTILSKCVASLRVNQKINLSDVPASCGVP
jgi:hypothetical protein